MGLEAAQRRCGRCMKEALEEMWIAGGSSLHRGLETVADGTAVVSWTGVRSWRWRRCGLAEARRFT